MNVKPLTESYSWKGRLYKKGTTQIPEDLAQALGIVPPEPPKEHPSEPAAEQPAEQQAEPEPEEKTSSRRSKK